VFGTVFAFIKMKGGKEMKYLIAAHGAFPTGIINSLALIVGELSAVDIFQMTKNKSAEDAEKEVKAYLDQQKDEELIVFTDVFGGSVANLFTQCLLEGYEFQLITGVNFPMLLSIILNESDNMQAVIQQGIQDAKTGIKHINQLLAAQKGGTNNDSIIIED
jgi:mannose/fructose-specific phosphotransferase system component IIA